VPFETAASPDHLLALVRVKSQRRSTLSEHHRVVTPDTWLKARLELLVKEKEFTRLRDQLNQQRRELPWKGVDKEYVFEGSKGRETLAELFENRSQLLIYHFMFAPDWETGCKHCSWWADNLERKHSALKSSLRNHGGNFACTAAQARSIQEAYGLDVQMASAVNTDFNYD
jgi:predicted dithiol-disulfide oxidoreductase (DUF899 family)